jgi:hypothetical protein
LALVRVHAASMTRDSKRMQQAFFEFRIRTGRFLSDGRLKEKNFRLGASALHASGQPSELWQLTRLAWANLTAGVMRDYARRVARRGFVRLRLGELRRYSRRFTP